MKGLPLVSVVVPVYNVRRYLERCDASIRAQTYSNIEIVYVDDGSTDGSAVVCDQLAQRPSTIVIHKENAGLGFARNTGMQAANGDYVVFLDSDDYYDENLISDLATPVIGGSVEFTLAGFTRIEGGKANSRALPDVNEVISGNREVMDRIFTRMLGFYPGKDDYVEMSACARLYNRIIAKQNGIWFRSERECLSEDLDFNSRYLQYVNSALCTSSVGYYYCDNEGSLTNRYRPDRFLKQKDIHAHFWRVADELGLSEEAYVRLDNTLASITRYCVKLEYLNWRAETHLSQQDVLSRIDEICSDRYLCDALARLSAYPVPRKNRAVNNLMLKRRTRLLLMVMAAKSTLGI